MKRKLKPGELGKILEKSETKHVCPACPKTFDSQQEMVEHFVEEHEVTDLDQDDY